MFKTIQVPTIRVRSPRRPRPRTSNAANIWEAARIAEKYDNYCIPTPEGFEVRYNGKVQRITGPEATGARMIAVQECVDPSDWILYCYTLQG